MLGALAAGVGRGLAGRAAPAGGALVAGAVRPRGRGCARRARCVPGRLPGRAPVRGAALLPRPGAHAVPEKSLGHSGLGFPDKPSRQHETLLFLCAQVPMRLLRRALRFLGSGVMPDPSRLRDALLPSALGEFIKDLGLQIFLCFALTPVQVVGYLEENLDAAPGALGEPGIGRMF